MSPKTSRPLAFFAGIRVPNWTSVRKVKEGETKNDLYGFLTTDPNQEIAAIHPKAMPVVLRTSDEIETRLTAAADEALKAEKAAAGCLTCDRRHWDERRRSGLDSGISSNQQRCRAPRRLESPATIGQGGMGGAPWPGVSGHLQNAGTRIIQMTAGALLWFVSRLEGLDCQVSAFATQTVMPSVATAIAILRPSGSDA
jgi:hypothetical protein